VDPVPDRILLRKSGSPGNRTRTSIYVAGGSGLWTTEAVCFLLHGICGFISYLGVSTVHLRRVAEESGRGTTEAVLYYN
jgi:hypothetical protein